MHVCSAAFDCVELVYIIKNLASAFSLYFCNSMSVLFRCGTTISSLFYDCEAQGRRM